MVVLLLNPKPGCRLLYKQERLNEGGVGGCV